jgi:hypothetical protein
VWCRSLSSIYSSSVKHCSMVRRVFSMPRSFGSLCHRGNAGSSFGWFFMVEVGLQTSSLDTDCMMMRCVPYVPKTLRHLITFSQTASSAREVWFKLLPQCGCQHLTPDPNASFVQWWLYSCKAVVKGCRKAFDLLVILGG